MDAEQVSRARIANLGLAAGGGRDPAALVRALGAVQAQDYVPASTGASTAASGSPVRSPSDHSAGP